MTRVRVNADNNPASPGLNTDGDHGSLVIADGTGLTLTTPSAADIKGAPMVAGASYGCTLSATNGTITIKRSGRYRVGMTTGDVENATNSATLTLEIQKNAASFTNKILTKWTQPGTAIAIAPLPPVFDVVDLVVGDVIKAVGTASGGNLVFKQFTLYVEQIADAPLTHE